MGRLFWKGGQGRLFQKLRGMRRESERSRVTVFRQMARKCKGPEVGMCLIHGRKKKESSTQQGTWQRGGRKSNGNQPCQACESVERSLVLLW